MERNELITNPGKGLTLNSLPRLFSRSIPAGSAAKKYRGAEIDPALRIQHIQDAAGGPTPCVQPGYRLAMDIEHLRLGIYL